MLFVESSLGYGYCEPDGRSVTGCKYSFICDVGHGIWLASETDGPICALWFFDRVLAIAEAFIVKG